MDNKGEKLVSIIIAVYNGEKYITQAIESAIGQTYQNIEIVIVNDGSTDDTSNILEGYAKKDARIVIVNQKNGGVSAARNTGLRMAKGEYLCIVDGDDILLPDKIELQAGFLNEAVSADFTYSKVYYFLDGTNIIYQHDLKTISGPSVYKKLLQYGNFIYTSTVFFRRAVFDTYGGFDESLRSAEEFDYWLSLTQQGVSFLHQDRYLTLCRSRTNGLTSDSVTMYSRAVAVFKKYLARSKYPWLAKVTSYQYFKSSILLKISILRKPKPRIEEQATTVTKSTTVSAHYYLNKIYGILKKIKFSMTFKKVQNNALQQYLDTIESYNTYE